MRSKSISIPQAKFEPNPTPGRILGDLSQRAPNIDRGVPLYYEDLKLHCADCGKQEVWTAEQQKWWYEVEKKSTSLQALKC